FCRGWVRVAHPPVGQQASLGGDVHSSPAPPPVEGPSLLMCNCQNANVVIAYPVQHAVWEPFDEPPAYAALDLHPREWQSSQGVDCVSYLGDKRISTGQGGLERSRRTLRSA